MLSTVKCPGCQYRFSIDEGDMGKRTVCPNCQSPFFAGKSVAEVQVGASAAPPPQPGFAKTMIGESGPAIKYNCPRCKAALEAPAEEAGTKKPCPSCGQRLQVPAAPQPAPAATQQPNLNKTMLADEGNGAAPPIKYNCPNCKRPLESPAAEAGTKKPCPKCGQRLQIPAASTAGPNLNKTMLAGEDGQAPAARAVGGYAAPAAGGAPGVPAPPAGQPMPNWMTPRNMAIGAGILVLLLFVVPAVVRGGKRDDMEAMLKRQQELEKANAEVAERKDKMDEQKAFEAKTRHDLEDMANKIRNQDDRMRDEHRQALGAMKDQRQRDEFEQRFEMTRRKWEQEKREMEKNQQRLLEEAKARLDDSKRALDAAQQRQQTIIQQPAPVVYYPPYHPRYYWWW